MKAIFYDWGGANVWLFHVINDWRGDVFDRFMLLGTQISDYRNFAVYITLACLTALLAGMREHPSRSGMAETTSYRWLCTLTLFCIAYLADGLLLTMVKPWLDFPRPQLALPGGSVHVIGETELHRSLPSGHVAFAVTFIASLWPMLNRNWRWMGVLFVCWVALSRVNVGAHFPADVLTSLVTALPIVFLVRFVLNAILRSLEKRRARTSSPAS